MATPAEVVFRQDANQPQTRGRLEVLSVKHVIAALVCCTLTAGGAVAQTGAERLHQRMPGELWEPAEVDWVNDVAVIAMPYMSGDQRETLLQDFDLDMLDWYCGMTMNAGKFFRHRGIRCSAPEEYEYQEALQFSRADTVELFEDNGIAITLDGSVAHFPEDRYGGAQFMTHLAPKWHEVVKQGMARVAPFGDSVTQDNIGVPLIKGNGNFSDWAKRQFQRWLRDRYDRAQLADMGVERARDVQMRTYINDLLEEGTKEEALEDRLVREYIRFMYFAHLEAWLDCATATKRRAAQAGLPIPAVYGNQWGAWGTSPYATIQSQYTDVVWIEGGCVQPPFGHTTTATAAMFYRIGRAAGGFERPVWTIEYPGHSHPDSRLAQAVVLSDAFSNGGFVVGLWGMGETSGPRYEVNREYYGLAGQYRPLFTRRKQLADVAVVWNFPSHYWRSFSALRTGIANQGLVSNFFRMLEDLHIPCEAAIFGHRDVFDDSAQLQRLARHRVIIVPAADCMSDRHAGLLKRLARSGATIVITGETGTRDEDYRPRERPVLADVLGDTNEGRVAFGDGAFVVLPEQFIDDWHGDDREGARRRLREVVEAGLGRAPTVRTDAPMLLWTNPWLCAEGRVLAVHLTNYDVDLDADTLRPVEDLFVDVRLPDGLPPDSATLLRPGGEPRELQVEVAEGRARVQVPRVDQYAVLAIHRGDALEAACTLAEGSRSLDRIHVASLGRELETGGLQAREQRSRRLLAAGEHQRALTAARILQEEAGARLQQVIDGNLSRERTEHQARLASDAPRRFDFGEEGVAEGWSEVRADTPWSEERGYGWLSARDAAGHGGGEPDALHGDTLRGREPATFAVRVPDGRHEVTLIEGDPGGYFRCSVTQADVGGVSALLGARHWGGVFSTRTFLADAEDGRLEITLHGDAVGPCYRNSTGWQLAGMTIRPVEGEPSAQARAWQRRCRSALRDWRVVGTFDDDSCEALSLVYPPERNPVPDATYQDGTRRVQWRRYTAPDEGMAPVPLDALFDDTDGAVAYGMTHLHVPAARSARLLVGTTGRAQVWLNGEEVVRDEVTDGLRFDEFDTPVRLRQGWNSLLVKVANNWHGAFAFSACVTDPERRPLERLASMAAGDVQIPPALPLGTPQVEHDPAALEPGGQVTATVSFTNSSDRPLSGEIALRPVHGPAAFQALTIEPQGQAFEGLAPGETASAEFRLSSTGLPARDTIPLAATVSVGERVRTKRWSLPFRRPRLEMIPVTAHEPRELQVAAMDSATGWQFNPDRPLEGRVELETEDVKEGEGALRVTIESDGDGTEDYPQVEPDELPGLTDWSGYDRLSLWAKVTDEDDRVQSRPIAVVIYDQEGRQHSVRTDVPAGQWRRLEWDISGVPRWQIPRISIYLYEHETQRETTCTWLLDDMRLTRTEAAAPPSPRSIPVTVAVINPLTRPVEGTVTVSAPGGWEVEPAASLTVPAERSRAARVYVTPPADAQGDHELSARFVMEQHVLRDDAGVLVRPQVTVPRTEHPPELDGRLDDAAWEAAARLSGFVLNEDCALAPTPTEVLLTWDDRALYVAYRCAEPQMDELVAGVTQADGHVWEDDCLEFYLDPDAVPGGHDHYVVNALGTIRVERGGSPGWGWHTRAAAEQGESEWTAEVMVLFEDYQRPPRPGDRWLANFNRTRQGKPGSPTEYQCWSCTHGSFERPDRFGQLIFTDGGR